MYCHVCQYDLRESHGRCPECGRAFLRSDPGSYSRYPFSRWRVLVLKALAACDHWWFYLGGAFGFGIPAVIAGALWARIEYAILALLNLYALIRRVRKGPHLERVLRESAR